MNWLNEYYFLKMNLLLLAVAAVYFLALKRVNLPVTKRLFLLAGSVAAFLLPLLSLPSPVNGTLAPVLLPEVKAGGTGTAEQPIQFSEVLIYLYLSVTAIFILRFLHGLYRLDRLRKKSVFSVVGGIPTCVNPDLKSTFSFGNRVYTPSLPLAEETLLHEQLHIEKQHTVDKLWFQALVCLWWFNPAVFLLRKWAEENHEYEVDQLILLQGIDPDRYSSMLINAALDQNDMRFSNTFSQFQILKTRIKMMTTKSSKTASWRWLYLIPAAAGALLLVQACEKGGTTQNPTLNEETNGQLYLTIHPDSGKKQPVTMRGAEFKGGFGKMAEYLGKNLVYPEAAKKSKAEGTVIVTFEVDPVGKVRNARVVESKNPVFNEEALRAVNAMPAWDPAVKEGKPCTAEYTLPIRFQYTGDAAWTVGDEPEKYPVGSKVK